MQHLDESPRLPRSTTRDGPVQQTQADRNERKEPSDPNRFQPLLCGKQDLSGCRICTFVKIDGVLSRCKSHQLRVSRLSSHGLCR